MESFKYSVKIESSYFAAGTNTRFQFSRTLIPYSYSLDTLIPYSYSLDTLIQAEYLQSFSVQELILILRVQEPFFRVSGKEAPPHHILYGSEYRSARI